MGMFKRGFKEVSKEKERQDVEREKRQSGLWRFYLTKDGEEADISFLTEDPINFWEHNVKTFRNGKEAYDNVPCTGDDCPICANGDKPQFKSAWLIIDHREYEYKDKDNKKKTGKDQIRLFVYGTKIASQLDRKSQRYGLVGTIYTMIRLGKGTSTTYTFENGKAKKYTSKEIENLLNDKLKEQYNGSMDSLYDIVESQLQMLVKEDTSSNEKDDEYDEELQDNIVSVDDDEEYEAPKKKSVIKKKVVGRKENSTKKSSIKSILGKRK